MLRFLLGLVVGAGALTGSAYFFMRGIDGCLDRCGGHTHCVDHHCEADLQAAPATPAHDAPRRRGGKKRDPGAAPELQLRPGDNKPTAQGDSLGRTQRIDLTAPDDGAKELTQEDMDRVVRAGEPAILRCITDAVGDYPLDSGRVEVGMRIERGGEVSRVRVEAPQLLQRQGVTRCIRGAVISLRFPPSGGASVATYPFELK